MSTENTLTGMTRTGKTNRYHFDRHTPEYREQFADDHRGDARQVPGGVERHLRRALGRRGHTEVFELARCPHVSNDHDLTGERRGYKGISIPTLPQRATASAAASWRWTRPSSGTTAASLNPYLSPAAVERWKPFVDEIVRASLDEKIETRPDRLRRRPRQHRARGAHPGDDGDPAEEVDDLRRAGPRLGVHPAELA